MVQPPKDLHTLNSLIQIVAALRGPEGCPWDKEQTHQSLTRFALEEAYELVEAIEKGDRQEFIEELGDYLFQVALHIQIAQETGNFTWVDVLSTLNEKMVRRHPHVFGEETAQTPEEVLARWGEIKAEEKKKKPKKAEGFNVPLALPALMRAQKLGEKSQGVGFDWSSADQVWDKLHEELDELREDVNSGERTEMESELGDVLFCVSQLARHLGFEGEQALRLGNLKFETRFAEMLRIGGMTRDEFAKLSPDKKEELWAKAKHALKK